MPNQQEMYTLLEQRTAALQKLSEESLLRPRISGFRALELSNLLARSLKEEETTIKAALSDARYKQYQQDLKELLPAAKSLYAADLRSKENWTERKELRRKVLAPVVKGLDRELFYWAWGLFRDNDEHRELLEEIRKGTGQRDDAEDVLRLVDLLLTNWKEVENNAPLTKKDLEQARSDANELVGLLTSKGLEADKRKNLWWRAFTDWHMTYQRLLAVGRFASFGDNDSKERFPSLSTR